MLKGGLSTFTKETKQASSGKFRKHTLHQRQQLFLSRQYTDICKTFLAAAWQLLHQYAMRPPCWQERKTCDASRNLQTTEAAKDILSCLFLLETTIMLMSTLKVSLVEVIASTAKLSACVITPIVISTKTVWSNYFWPTGHFTKTFQQKYVWNNRFTRYRRKISELRHWNYYTIANSNLLHNSISGMLVVEDSLTLCFLY